MTHSPPSWSRAKPSPQLRLGGRATQARADSRVPAYPRIRRHRRQGRLGAGYGVHAARLRPGTREPIGFSIILLLDRSRRVV